MKASDGGVDSGTALRVPAASGISGYTFRTLPAPRTSSPGFVFAPVDETWRLGASAYVLARRDSPLVPAINTVFGRMAVEDSVRGGRELRLDLRGTEDGAWRFFASGLPIFRVKDGGELVPMLEGTLVGYAVRTRDDCAVFHAASVEIDRRLILLCGGKGSGKSTLALALSRQGARYFGDELAFVRFRDQTLEAFPKAITLKAGSFDRAPESKTYPDPIRGPIRYDLPLSSAAAGEEANVGMIVFPAYTPGASEVRITELEPYEVALGLIQQCFGGLERDPRMMDMVAALSKVPAYAVELPDADHAITVLRRLL